ncbi:MAG: response regulator [Desulfarculus sp.]|nr:response regulator [Desulfarculus sp.]
MDGKIILLVEDNPDDELMTLMALRENHVSNPIIVARDGEQALAYLLGDPAQPAQLLRPLPQLVILDLGLPKVHGLEVLKAIRGNPSTHLLPVVILTSSTQEDELARSYTLGANSVVRKPLEHSDFVGAVRQLGLYWMVLNEPPPLV